MDSPHPPRRTAWRYISLLLLVAALFGGWSWFWYAATERAQATVDGWRAREAQAGRIYACGSEEYGGYPFRFELTCSAASALFQSNQPPVEVKARGILVAAQVYQPTLLITEVQGPLTVASPGRAPHIVVNWKLAQSSVRGTPAAPERISVSLDKPVVDGVDGGSTRTLLRASRMEIHGRLAEGSALNKPVIEVALRLAGVLAPDLHPAMAQPLDANIDTVLRGLNDFSAKPWHERFRQIQADGGRIDVTQARVQQGETIAVGSGTVSINPNGRLQGQLRVTVAGLEPFLKLIGAQQIVQTSPTVDKLAGALDRLSPGLGNMARQQVGANLSAGINMLGEQTTLEGHRAVTLPLRFEEGRMFLGPIPLGDSPALF
jgi:hypothetical protein